MRKIVVVACVAAVSTMSVLADTLTWKGGSTGRFTQSSNWTSADSGTTSNSGPQPGDTVKFSNAVELDDETFNIGSDGLIIENSSTLINKVVFTGSGKIVKKGNGELKVKSDCTHTGGTRVEAGRMNFCDRNFKSFGTGKIEVVCDGTSNGLAFTTWNSVLRNEVEIVGAASGCQPLYCSDSAVLSGSISSDGDFTIYNGWGSFRIMGPINAHGHVLTAQCEDLSPDTQLNITSAIDASLVKSGARSMRLSGVSTQIDASLTVNNGELIFDPAAVWGGTNVVVNGATSELTASAAGNFSMPPIVKLLNGGRLNISNSALTVMELWIGDVRLNDGYYMPGDIPGSVTGTGGLLIVGNKVWTGGESGLFSKGENWSDGQPPRTGDMLVFGRSTTLETEIADIGADGISIYVHGGCTVTNNCEFTGSGLLAKHGQGELRTKPVLTTTGGIKIYGGSVYPDRAIISVLGEGTVEIDATRGSAALLDSRNWDCVVSNHVKITSANPNSSSIRYSNGLKLVNGIESDSDFTIEGLWGPLTVLGEVKSPGKTMSLIIGWHDAFFTSYLCDTIDCSVKVTSYLRCGILEMQGVSTNTENTLTVNGCTNRLTAAAYWGGTNVVVKKTGTFPAHLILEGESNLNPEATLTLSDGGTVEVTNGMKANVAHLVTDGVVQRSGVYTASNLPNYIRGSGRIQVGFPGMIIIIR